MGIFGSSGIFGTAYSLTAMSQFVSFVSSKVKKYMTSYVDSIPVDKLADKFAANDYNPNTISDEDMKRYEEKGKFLMGCKDYFKACDGQSEDMTLTACHIVGKLADHYENNPAMLGYCVENFKLFFIKGDTIMDTANNIMIKSKEAQEQGKTITGDMIKSWIVGQTVSGFIGDKSNKYVYSEENHIDDEEKMSYNKSGEIKTESSSDPKEESKIESKNSNNKDEALYFSKESLYPSYSDPSSTNEIKISDIYAESSDKMPEKGVSGQLYNNKESNSEKTDDRYQKAVDAGLPTEDIPASQKDNSVTFTQ